MSNDVPMTEKEYYSYLKANFNNFTENQCNSMTQQQKDILYQMLDDEMEARVTRWLLLGKALIQAQRAPLTITVQNQLFREIIRCINVIKSQKDVYVDEFNMMEDIVNERSEHSEYAAKFMFFVNR